MFGFSRSSSTSGFLPKLKGLNIKIFYVIALILLLYNQNKNRSMKYTFIICLVFLCIESENKCIHPIFCSQEVLEKVAKSNYFEDSKEFVDLILKVSIQQALENFQKQSIPDWIDSSFTNASTILEPA